MRKLFILLILLNFLILKESVSQVSQTLNFECGGYVTAIYPVKYIGTVPDPSAQILYARTDIGGFYKSTNNGANWLFKGYLNNLSQTVAMKKGDLQVLSVAINPDNHNIVFLAVGDGPHNADWDNCLYKTTNGGDNWIKISTPNAKCAFMGNNFNIKTGGECLIYDPTNSNIMYMGGIPHSSSMRGIFRSTDGGNSWSIYGNSLQINQTDTIICISKHPSRSNELWVGTTSGVYRTTNNGVNFQYWNNFRYTRRILLRENGDAFIAWGLPDDIVQNPNPVHLDNGLEKFTHSTSTWNNITWKFNTGNGFDYNQGNIFLAKTFFTTLTFYNNNENNIIAGRYGRPLRISSDYGETWFGNNYSGFQNNFEKSQVLLVFQNPNDKPNHQFLQDYVYTGLNHFVQNPNSGRGDYWYSSGGSSLFLSENRGIELNSKWKYSYQGMNMPVIFDISFQNFFYSNIQVPLADWTNAYTTYNLARSNNKFLYDNQHTRINNQNTYIGLTSRALYSPLKNLSVSYLLGHDQYGYLDYKALIVKRVALESTPSFHRYTNFIQGDCFDAFSNSKRAIVDGIVYKKPGENDLNIIICLVGYSEGKKSPNEMPDLGIYTLEVDCNANTSNNSSICSAGDFSGDAETSNIFNQSLIPGSSKIDGSFNSQFNLANGPVLNNSQTTKVRNYLYLENAGFFISDDNGQNWVHKSNVVSNEYRDEGTVKYSNDTIFIAIKNRGVYYAKERKVYETGSAIYEFEKLNTFTSAEQIEHKYFPIDGKSIVYVFGKKSGDNDNKLYTSTSGATGNYTSISTTLPYIRSLRFNPDGCKYNELWIGTSGQGILVYNGSGSPIYSCANYISESITINHNQEFINDIIVENGTTLTLDGNVNLKFNEGKKLIIAEGGNLIINQSSNVTFTKSDDASSWGGIEFRGTAKGIIKNAVFENCQTAINIVSGISEMPADTIIIENNTFKNGNIQISDRAGVKIVNNSFDYSTGNGQILSGVGSTASNNILIKDNIINYNENLMQTVGINIIYGDNVVIYNNQINNCHTGISASNSSPHIYFNQINFTSEGSTGISLDNSLSPVLKGNSITNYYTGINNYLSSPVMYKNNIQNELYSAGTGLSLIYNSIAKMEADNYENAPEWSAGLNEILLPNAGIGIFVDNYSYPVMKCSQNKVFGEEYIMKGKTNYPNMTIDAINNNWLRNPASGNDFDLDCGIDYETYSENIPDINNSPNLFSIGFNIQDTLFKSDESSCPTENSGGENYLFYTANKFEREGNYSAAKQKYEQIVSEYRSGKYSKTALKKILLCADNLNLTSADYSNLRSYYQTLRNNNLADTSFANISEELSIKCLIRKSEFENAINEYENIVTSSSDSAKILNSQLNIIETYLIMSNQGDNLNGNGMTSYTGRIPALKPNSLKDAINKMNSILGRNKGEDNFTALPTEFELSQNYPNPFNPVTKINFNIPKDGYVKLKVYDMLGREIATLVNNEFKQPGRYTVEFNGSSMSSGIYFYRLETKDFVQTRKMVLVK